MSSTAKWLLAGLLGLAAIAIWKRKTIVSMTYNDIEALANPNLQKAKTLVQRYESKGGDYRILYGGGHFDSYAGHPNVRVPFVMPLTGKPEISTAAGAYQINHPTWLEVQAFRVATGRGLLPDFSPKSQDMAFVDILIIDGTLDSIIKGNWTDALIGLSKRWASMPMDKTGQSRLAMADALKQLVA